MNRLAFLFAWIGIVLVASVVCYALLEFSDHIHTRPVAIVSWGNKEIKVCEVAKSLDGVWYYRTGKHLAFIEIPCSALYTEIEHKPGAMYQYHLERKRR